MTFDEETEQALDEYVEEMSEAQREHDLMLWEGCAVVTAPTGAPPEYITVEVDGVNDPNVEWRGTPSTPAVGDEVLVWENPVSHRREIIGASGAGGVTGGGSWCQKVVVAECGGDFTSLSAAVAWINALPAGQAPAATRLYAINVLGGNFAEAADVTVPQYVHVVGEGEGSRIEMGANTLIMSDDTSLLNLTVTSTDPVDVIRMNNSDCFLRNVTAWAGTAGAICFNVTGDSYVRMFECDARATTVGVAAGFYWGGTSYGHMFHCYAVESMNWAAALHVTTTNINGMYTRYCAFLGNADDVVTGAGSRWYHLACHFRLSNSTLAAGTHHALPTTRFNQTVIVAEEGGDFQVVSDAITWINAQGDAAANKRYGIKVLAGNFAEAGNITVPQYVHVAGMGEGSRIEMGANTVNMSDDSSLMDLTVTGSSTGITITDADCELFNVQVVMSGGFGLDITGDSVVQLRHVVVEATAAIVFGFTVINTANVTMYDCEADDSTNIGTALNLVNAACTCTTRHCTFAGSTNDVWVGAAATWNSYKDQVDPMNCTIGGTAVMLDADAGDSYAVTVKNTSGAAANPGDLGYIDEAGEYQTTATAYLDAEWCVVVIGGPNNGDIWVARRGRVTVTLNGNCAAGDCLYTSTTAGQAQPQSYMRPEMFAVALTANAAGAGGTCEALLHCHTRPVNILPANTIYRSGALCSDSDWQGTIAGLPGGAILTYNIVGGDENCLRPNSVNEIAKLTLFNTTRGDSALISDVNLGANQITLTAAVPGGWIVGDNIDIRSQTNLNVSGASRYFDYEITGTDVPELTRGIDVEITWVDTGAAGERIIVHPWQAYAASKRLMLDTTVANRNLYGAKSAPLFQRRYTMQWTASGAPGAGTALHIVTLMKAHVASP